MRIIGGQFKGRRFRPPSSFKGRPTTDFAREALFNLLNSRIDLTESSMLDLFSGTGAISLEAVSRGVKAVTAVEKDPRACGFIKECLETLGFKMGIVLRDDVVKFLSKSTAQYDLVIADPPFAFILLGELPKRIAASGVMKKGGLFILEHGEDHRFEQEPGFVEMRKYGAVHFSFFNFES